MTRHPKDTNMDNPNVLLIGAAKLLSMKSLSLAAGIIGILLALNGWFLSRLVTNLDQNQAAIQRLEIADAVKSARLDEIDNKLNRLLSRN